MCEMSVRDGADGADGAASPPPSVPVVDLLPLTSTEEARLSEIRPLVTVNIYSVLRESTDDRRVCQGWERN